MHEGKVDLYSSPLQIYRRGGGVAIDFTSIDSERRVCRWQPRRSSPRRLSTDTCTRCRALQIHKALDLADRGANFFRSAVHQEIESITACSREEARCLESGSRVGLRIPFCLRLTNLSEYPFWPAVGPCALRHSVFGDALIIRRTLGIDC